MRVKLTKAIVADAIPGVKEYIIWDTEVAKMGLRVLPTGRKSFIYQYRVRRLSRKLTLGPGDLPLAIARQLALEAASKVARGIDPGKERDDKRNEITVAELAKRFDATHIEFQVKDSTAREYRRAIKLYILPALGSKLVADVTRAHVLQLHQRMCDKPTQANRTLEIVSKMFNFAEDSGFREPNTNPKRKIKKYPETKRERFLSPAELQRVAEVLDEMAAERIEMPSAIAAVKLLMYTGCRLNEVMTLDWAIVDLKAGVFRLRDSKSGAKSVQLGNAAIDVLQGIRRIEDNPWVITGKIEGGRLTDLQPFWQRVRARAGLIDARIHDLRHTFATFAAEKGESLHMIGKMLGHSSTETTKRYAHHTAGSVRAAADRVSSAIRDHMYAAPNL